MFKIDQREYSDRPAADVDREIARSLSIVLFILCREMGRHCRRVGGKSRHKATPQMHEMGNR